MRISFSWRRGSKHARTVATLFTKPSYKSKSKGHIARGSGWGVGFPSLGCEPQTRHPIPVTVQNTSSVMPLSLKLHCRRHSHHNCLGGKKRRDEYDAAHLPRTLALRLPTCKETDRTRGTTMIGGIRGEGARHASVIEGTRGFHHPERRGPRRSI